MASLAERVRDIKRIGQQAKQSGVPLGEEQIPRRMLVIGAIVALLMIFTFVSKGLERMRGGRGSGAEGGAHQMRGNGAGVASGSVPAGVPSAGAGTSVEGQYRVFYSHNTDLGEIDAEVLMSARKRIDLVMEGAPDESACRAIMSAAARGARVRLMLASQVGAFASSRTCTSARAVAGVETRVNDSVATELRSYAVDDAKLRSGSAGLDGVEAADADLVLVGSISAVASFEREFARLWARPGNRLLSASPQ